MKRFDSVRKVLMVLLGNTLYALAVTCFILPNGLITGGTTGLALFFHHLWSIPVPAFVSVFNVVMFVLGAWVLGKTFALTTLLSTFYYPLVLSFFQRFPILAQLTQDRLLSAIYAGALIGIGIGIVLKAGASTGGMDIPPLICNKKLGLPVSVVMYAMDFTILLLQMLFSDSEQVLYGILVVFLYTLVLDRVLLAGTRQTEVKIISKRHEEINSMIQTRLDRGTTLVQAVTGYKRDRLPMVLTVISPRELAHLNQWVLEIDPDAFMIISQANEVKGRGFTIKKEYPKTDMEDLDEGHKL